MIPSVRRQIIAGRKVRGTSRLLVWATTQVALRNRKQGHGAGNGAATQVDNREQSRRWPTRAQVRGERVR